MSPGRLRDPSRGPAPVVPTPPVDPSAQPPASGPSSGPGAEPRVERPSAPGSTHNPGFGDQSAPLTDRTVLVPRDPERAAALASALRAAGARVLVSPAIERARVEDTAPVDDAVARLADGGYGWVVVTSVNAIDELAAAAERLGTPLGDVARTARWAAVGPATRRALEAVGVTVELEPAENSARGLVAAFEHRHPAASTVLLPQGDLAAPTMADGLRDLGHDPHVVTVYRTVAHDLAPEAVAAWRAGEVDAVVLTSGSVVREIARQLGPRDDVAAVAIGEPTARAARAVGLRLDAVADRPTDDALAAALTTVLSGAPITPAAPGPDIPR
ncbi:uroporphyrinogen-III synthase [Cellulosimicrobium sp. Marseille-Q4280]|uniref:uroporphyrinogen-III synthase n=1 Tax=Cellulosimicrobium sp. Marseille-Q4280 TaxID=2937992 RepID=UPI00203ED830|nr:uroporphyrinogen-III synthase [Cellulosimicrobium sp. Marseille-Q4280]